MACASVKRLADQGSGRLRPQHCTGDYAILPKMKCVEDLFGLQLSEIGMLQCVLLGFLRYNNDTRVTLR